MILRFVAVLAVVVAFIATGSTGAAASADQRPIAVFVTLPMTNGFADATDALVETLGVVHEALDAAETFRVVDRPQESDAVLTILGRGTGDVELTAALQGLDPAVVASPVMLRADERYVEAMLAVGACGDAAASPASHSASASCYRKIVVGLSGRDVRRGASRSARNPWAACADALARDVRAWVSQNANRLLALRG
ncbi:MAG TPA: hypothetical protein VE967_16705 [Gemmatimonadaceae bacterium]|nr:hypothetical protein [Vicinamibacterales bacterium]HYV99099.1 hypothetical protein [Gemmatimonadaceae bacterium]